MTSGHSCRLHGHAWEPQEAPDRDPDAVGSVYLECPHCLDTEVDPKLVAQFLRERKEEYVS